MTTAYTSLLGFALPVTGELSGTWGDTVNNGITSLLDSAIAGTTTLSADSDVTLTTTQGSSNTAREAILLWTAGGSATRTITAPAQSKIYTVINASSGTQSIILAGVGPTSGVTIAKGESALCAWNGSDFIKISNTAGPGTFTNLTVTGNTSLGDADTDTITQAASYVTGTQLKSAKTATNTLSLAAYDVDGTAYTNLITLTAGNTPTLALTSTGVGTINNMSIGATTASTGAFTTLSASGAVTLSGGTENGVAYLNGSKVLTTVSALVFDATNTALSVGGAALGTAANRTVFTLNATTSNFLSFGIGGTRVAHFYSDANEFAIANAAGVSGFITMQTNGAEALRLTATSLYTASTINVGIGTSSPLAKLNVSGGTTIASLAEWNSKANTVFTLANAAVRLGVGYDANDQPLIQGFDSTNGARPIGLQVYGGNVGIGTSSPTGSANRVVDVYGSGSSAVNFHNATSGTTATDGGVVGQYGNDLVLFNYEAGIIQFGTSNTEAARIDSSGNLGLGVTPSAWGTAWRSLDMFGWGSVASASDNMNVLNNAYITASGSVYKNTGLATRYNQSGGVHSWFNAASGTAGNAITFTQAMTLDTSGNLGIGTSSPVSRLEIKDTTNNTALTVTSSYEASLQLVNGGGSEVSVINAGGSNNLSLRTANTERARIDSSGNVGIAQTDPTNTGVSGYNNLVIGNSSSSTCGLTFKTVSTGTPLPGIAWSRGAGAGANGKVYYDQSTDRLYCQAGGSGGVYLAGGGTSWTSASDERVKDIIEPIENATQKLANWRTVIGKYKSDTDGVRRSFLIAQDVLTTFPEAVNTDKAEEYGLNYQDLIPLLVASIQELKAEFDAYKASHP